MARSVCAVLAGLTLAAGACAAQGPRLGVVVEKPAAVVAEQLELPKNQGLVVREVLPDSAAARAGLKAHDILLELNGQPVPADVLAFEKLVANVKARTPVAAVVLRKGKKETVEGVTFAEQSPRGGGFPFALPGLFAPSDGQRLKVEQTGDGGFKARYAEGKATIFVTGMVGDGKAAVSEIEIKDGETTRKYQRVEQVPEQYRDQVKLLIRRSERVVGK